MLHGTAQGGTRLSASAIHEGARSSTLSQRLDGSHRANARGCRRVAFGVGGVLRAAKIDSYRKSRAASFVSPGRRSPPLERAGRCLAPAAARAATVASPARQAAIEPLFDRPRDGARARLVQRRKHEHRQAIPGPRASCSDGSRNARVCSTICAQTTSDASARLR